MSFFSYRTRIPRHFDSHANVRSTTHRRGLLLALRSVAALLFLTDPADVQGVYPAAVAAPSPVGLSYALSRGMCCGSSFVGSGRSTTILSIVAARSLRSSTFAPAITTPSGPPVPGHRSPGSFWCPFSSVGGGGFLPIFTRSGPCPASRRPAATPTAPRRVRHTRRPRPPRFARRSLLQPSMEPVVDSALGSVPLGQLVPLAALRSPEVSSR